MAFPCGAGAYYLTHRIMNDVGCLACVLTVASIRWLCCSAQEVLGTPWEGDAFFGNRSLVRSHLTMPAAWSDIVRITVLLKYGHFWMDTDLVLYRGTDFAEHVVQVKLALGSCMQGCQGLAGMFYPCCTDVIKAAAESTDCGWP